MMFDGQTCREKPTPLSSGKNQLRESGDLTSKLGVCRVYPANWTWLEYQPFKVHWFFHLFWIIWLGFSICYIARGRRPPLQAPNVKTPAKPNPNRGFSPVSACQCDRLEPRNAAATPVATPGTTTSFALSTLNSGCWRGNGGDNSSLSLSLAHAWGHNDTLATIALIHGCEGRIFRARENEKVGEPQGKCGKFKLMQIAQWCHVLSQFGRKCLMQCTCTSVALQPPVWANVRATRKTINVFQLSMGWFKKTSKPRIPCFFTRKYGGFQRVPVNAPIIEDLWDWQENLLMTIYDTSKQFSGNIISLKDCFLSEIHHFCCGHPEGCGMTLGHGKPPAMHRIGALHPSKLAGCKLETLWNAPLSAECFLLQ